MNVHSEFGKGSISYSENSPPSEVSWNLKIIPPKELEDNFKSFSKFKEIVTLNIAYLLGIGSESLTIKMKDPKLRVHFIMFNGCWGTVTQHFPEIAKSARQRWQQREIDKGYCS
jgi:hypothetical protein